MYRFTARLEIIVGNPYVFIPESILFQIFEDAQKAKGKIPVTGTVNGKKYQQTLLRYSGDWRLYINMKMLKDSPRRIGELIDIEVGYDPNDRSIKPHPKFAKALKTNKEAKRVFDELSPSRQKEMVRYISNLKSEVSVERNVTRAIKFLLGKESFVGRDKP